MELEQIRHFIKVAQHGSFSRTAASLGVSQPYLSRQIRQLENELSRHLFYRHGRGIVLTPAGESFLKTAQSVIEQLEQAKWSQAQTDSELTGCFTLGLPPSLARLLTLPLVRDFSQRFPKARLAVVETLSRNLQDQILAHKINAAILHDAKASPLLELRLLGSDRLCLIAGRDALPQGDAMPFSELMGLPLIFPCAPNPLRALVEAHAATIGVTLDIAYEIDGVESILELVHAGFGYTVALSNAIRASRFSDQLQALPLALPSVKSILSIATAAHVSPNLLHERAILLVQEAFARAHPNS